MPSRSEHREAVARRLELLRAELDPDAVPPDPVRPDPVPTDAPTADAPTADAPWWETAPVLELGRTSGDDAQAPTVPVPGRHASRRRGATLLPETLRGRVALGPWHLAVLGLALAAGLGLTCWWLVRAEPVATPVTTTSTGPLLAASSGAPPAVAPTVAPTGERTAAATVTVDVAGRVHRPGVLALPAGSRVVDAIRAAGGVRAGTDLSGLNRARVLVDGEQVVVGGPPRPTGSPARQSEAPGGDAPGSLVDLNTATAAELDALPDVGPVTAQSILDYRAEHGGFASVDELLDVDGIGAVTLSKIAPHVTV